MTVLDAKAETVPFGRNTGWPLGALMERRFGEFAYLLNTRASCFGEFKEALDTLAGDPAVADRIRRYRTQRATTRINNIHLTRWAWR